MTDSLYFWALFLTIAFVGIITSLRSETAKDEIIEEIKKQKEVEETS